MMDNASIPPGANPADDPVDFQHRAFLSYNQKADRVLAKALETALEQFSKKWYRRRAFDVFRDATALGANAELWTTLKDALGRTEFFILLASPESAASPWVGEELKYWLENRGREKFLIAWTSGRIAWDQLKHDFNWTTTDALDRRVLEGAFVEEPLWADFSWARGLDEQAIRRHERFSDQVATLASALHGRTKSDLFGEDLRQHRRQMSLARIAVASLLALLVVALWFWRLSIHRADLLATSLINEQEARKDAEQNAKTATSRQFAALSVLERDRQLDRSLILGVVAARAENTFEARDCLFKAIRDRPGISSFLHTERGNVACVAYSPDGKTIAAGCRGGVVLFDSASRQRLAEDPLDVKEGTVQSVAFSLDGKTIAAGYRPDNGTATRLGQNSGGVVVWDAASRSRLTKDPLDLGEREVASVALSPDGKTIAAGYTAKPILKSFGGVMVWDVASREQLKGVGPDLCEGRVSSVAFSPDGKTLAVGGVEERRAPDAPDGYPETGPIELHESWVKSLAVGPDVNTTTARRLRLENDSLLVKEGDVTSVAFSRDGKTVAACYQGGVVLWDAIGRKRLAEEPLAVKEGYVTSVALSPDGQVIVAGYGLGGMVGGVGVVAWEEAGRKQLTKPPLVVKGRYTTGVALGPDRKSVAVGSAGINGGVVVFELAGRNSFAGRQFAVGKGEARVVAFSPDGRTIAAGYHGEGGGGVVIWDAASLERLAEQPLAVQGGDVTSVAVGLDGKTIAAGSVGDKGGVGVVVRDAAGREGLAEVPPSLQGHHVTARVALSQDGKTVAAGFGLDTNFGADGQRLKPSTELFPVAPSAIGYTDGGVMVWDAAGRKRLRLDPLPMNKSCVTCVALSPDGTALAAGYGVLVSGMGGGEGGVVVRHVPGGKRLVEDAFPVKEGEAVTVAFSPDGKTIAAGYHAGVVMWDVAGAKRLAMLSIAEEEGDIACVAFSPDGKALAAGCGGAAGGVVVWDLVRRKRLAAEPFVLDGHGPVDCLAFSPDGRVFAAGYNDGTVVLWDIDLKTWQRIAGRIANRNFTWDEWRRDFPDDHYRRTFRNLPWPSSLPSEEQGKAERWEADNPVKEEELTKD